MIERLGANATGTYTQAIQPVTVPSTPGVADSHQSEVLVNESRLNGETQWLGAMNAYRIARTIEGQEPQLFATAKGTAQLNSVANPGESALISTETGLLQAANQPGEPALVPTIAQLDEDHRAGNDLAKPLQLGREAQLRTGTPSETADGVAQTVLAGEANTVMGSQGEVKQSRDPLSATAKRRVGSDTRAIATRPAVFRGHLIRLGQTSRFVLKLPT